MVKEYVSSIELSETDKFMNVGATGTLIATVGTVQLLIRILYGHLLTMIYVMLTSRVI